MLLARVSLVVLAAGVLSAGAPRAQVLLDGCDGGAPGSFTVLSGSLAQSGCRVLCTGPGNGFAAARWNGTLPDAYRVAVEVSRPGTDGFCDPMGFILGGTTSGPGLATSGIRILVMSWPSFCSAYPYAIAGRIEVADASDGTTQYALDTAPWDLEDPLRLGVEVSPGSVTVFANGQMIGSVPVTLAERNLTLLSYDDDEAASFGHLLVYTGSVSVPAPGAGREVDLSPPAPHPARGEATLTYALGRASSMRLSVIDARGRVVAVLAGGERPAGRHAVRLATDHLPAGLYWVLLQTPETRLARRVVVVN